jgi:hypothetical protein
MIPNESTCGPSSGTVHEVPTVASVSHHLLFRVTES